MSRRNVLADVMSAEIDGVARRFIQDMSTSADPHIVLVAAISALEAGASPKVVAEELAAAEKRHRNEW